MKKTILITGIGGNVGQGILRNIKSLNYDLTTIGCNIDAVSAGNHLCKKVYKVPYAYEANYLEQIRFICDTEKVDLIIPSTDYEALYLSKNTNVLPLLATNDHKTNEVFTDKYFTWIEFSRHTIPFAKSFFPSAYNNEFTHTVLKPRKGRGSRGVIFDPPSVKGFSDDDYMVQELMKGIEITSGFYIDKNNNCVGKITFERHLANGATNLCKTTNAYDNQLNDIIQKMTSHFKIKGSCNIQAIIYNGTVIPFEINGRISGTNSIRAQFGFNDVQFTLDELLFNKEIKAPVVTDGAAIRMLVDVIYPGKEGYKAIEDCSINNFVF